MYDDMIEINEDMLSDTLLHGNDMEHAEGILEDTQHLRTARNVLVRLIKESKLIV